MKKIRLIIPIALGLCLMSQASWAKKAYVTDSFRISIRRGPSIENKILEFLPSGMPVEILESKEGWNLVQPLEAKQGKMKGWVLSRYLITRLPWENQAKSLIQETTVLKEKLSRIEKEWEETLKRKVGDYSELKESNEATQETIQTLTKENENLKSFQRNFTQGALVLLCGLIIGLILGRQQKKRRSSLYY
ncbi:MAG: SH3 domain-containing protein [Deltaproteobacteria bacterium]|nr:SH3 domain-containing protein [Deltaproteobacteria bacterium]